MKTIIQRNKPSAVQTLGELIIPRDIWDNRCHMDLFTCKTLELPYKDNKQNISSILAGTYQCKKGRGWKIPYLHIHILDVPNRTGIRIHKGNKYTQIRGCILVGDSYFDMNGDGVPDIRNSKKTLKKLLAILPDRFELEIRDAE